MCRRHGPRQYMVGFNLCGMAPLIIVRGMSRDQSIYQEPERFMPERYFAADGKLNDDHATMVFGCVELLGGVAVTCDFSLNLLFRFGRRICVGRHSVENTVWATI